MKRAALKAPQTGQAAVDAVLEPLVHNMNMVTGQHRNSPKLKALPSTATQADLIAAVNILIQRVQGDS